MGPELQQERLARVVTRFGPEPLPAHRRRDRVLAAFLAAADLPAGPLVRAAFLAAAERLAAERRLADERACLASA